MNDVLWIAGTPAAFVGQARYILDSALRSAGVTAPTLVDVTKPMDLARLRIACPAVALALGDIALRALGGDALPPEGIRALRGYLWDTLTGRLLGTLCPSDIVTDWTPWRALLDFDVRRAATEIALGAPPLVERGVTVCTTLNDIDELEICVTAAAMRKGGMIAVDIENTHDFQLACVGFAPTPERAWVIPASAPWQLDAIRMLCESATPKVLQNGQYDRFFLKRFCGIELRNQTFDVMLAHHAIAPELAGKKTEVGYKKAKSKRTVKSLKFLSSIYTRDRWFKNYDFESDEDRYVLCGHDCCITLDIAQKQAVQMEAA